MSDENDQKFYERISEAHGAMQEVASEIISASFYAQPSHGVDEMADLAQVLFDKLDELMEKLEAERMRKF
jgi:hypothetical protein